jgi:hypothetical protein
MGGREAIGGRGGGLLPPPPLRRKGREGIAVESIGEEEAPSSGSGTAATAAIRVE